nr:26S proteasome SU alpha7 [Cryptomonas curvata]
MTSINSGYDLSAITFSPEGRIFQIEYAAKIISKSSFVIGMTCKDGLIIISEKKNIFPVEKEYILNHIFQINKNTSLGATGLMNDILFLIERARFDCRNHNKFFSDSLTGKLILTKICSFLHLYTLYYHLRPLACSLVLGTICSNFYELYVIFFSGFFIKCFGGVIGINSEVIKVELESLMNKNLSCRKTIEVVIWVLKNFKSKKETNFLEVLWFSKENFSFENSISCNITNENKRLKKFLN